MNAVFVLACMISDEKVSIISLSLVVMTSSYSVGSRTLVVTLSSSTVAMAHHTAKRQATRALTQGVSHSQHGLLWGFLGSQGHELQNQTNPGLQWLSDPHHSPGLHLLESVQ